MKRRRIYFNLNLKTTKRTTLVLHQHLTLLSTKEQVEREFEIIDDDPISQTKKGHKKEPRKTQKAVNEVERRFTRLNSASPTASASGSKHVSKVK